MVYQHENPDEPDIMSWFPRREDYEDKPAILPDETYEEKIQRLHDTIEVECDYDCEVLYPDISP